jgi:hypothetical protein
MRQIDLDLSLRDVEVINQIRVAGSVFRQIQALYPDSIVAGGAPRDWLLNKTARDIDIFIYEPDWGVLTGWDICWKIRNELGFGLNIMGNNEYDIAPGQRSLIHVFEGHKHTPFHPPLKINIVVHNRSVQEVYKSFPTSLSRYWTFFHLDNGPARGVIFQIYMSNLAFLGEIKRIIYCRDREFTEGEKKYLQKIWKKVPNFSVLTDEEGFEHAREEGINTERWDLV